MISDSEALALRVRPGSIATSRLVWQLSLSLGARAVSKSREAVLDSDGLGQPRMDSEGLGRTLADSD